MDTEEWLERAKRHVFSAGVGDVAEQLCQANMRYGLARIHWAQRELGRNPDAIFIGAPDATVTRNRQRWRGGFGYGGQVRWSPDLAVLDALPNGCGMLVLATDGGPSEAEVRAAAADARSARLSLDGVSLAYDLGESNHFVDCCQLEEVLDPALGTKPPEQLSIIHSSGHEHRSSSPFGPGLYLHLSEELQRTARRISTPWGPIALLEGAAADRYHAFCARVQRFNHDRRELYARHIFGEHRVVCNATHQGMRAPGLFHLGSYWFDEAASPAALYPLTLGPDQPVYLVRARPNFSGDVLDELGWADRAAELGVREHLDGANLLPHGGGYSYPELERLVGVDGAEHRTFRVQRSDGETICIDDIRAPAFGYRGAEVLQRMTELEMGDPVARYRIRFVVKD